MLVSSNCLNLNRCCASSRCLCEEYRCSSCGNLPRWLSNLLYLIYSLSLLLLC
ncbi:hypothetical protein X975_21712, partial [Stegodyphus mimosarum]